MLINPSIKMYGSWALDEQGQYGPKMKMFKSYVFLVCSQSWEINEMHCHEFNYVTFEIVTLLVFYTVVHSYCIKSLCLHNTLPSSLAYGILSLS